MPKKIHTLSGRIPIPMVRTFFLAVILIATSIVSKAQLLTSTPTFPKDTGSVSIVVDVSKGNKALLDYANTEDVYVHIGAITNLSTSPSNWLHVKWNNFNTPDASVKATYLGNNKYRYTINGLRTFFNLGATETIQKIAILFRNGNGSIVQRNTDGSDMYVAVYTESFAGKFLSPALEPKFVPAAEPITIDLGDSIDVTYAVNNSSTLRIYYNGVLVEEVTSNNIINKKIAIKTPGNQEVIANGVYNGVTIRDTLKFFVATASAEAPLPSGVRDGINYEPGDTSAILVLYAPGKSRVSVIGEFNNWSETTEYQMNKTPDGNRFWIRIKGLQKGTEYAYQYLVSSTLRIPDPYTEKVLDPNNDQYITASTYPNLKQYPTGKTNGIVSILQTGKPAFTWQVPTFNRPDQRSLVIYELLLRDFIAAHDWKTLKDTLSYFKTLGVNAIQLMPINEFEGNESWGYNSSFYFAADKYYGTAESLKQFIDECHKNGIAVIMDIALNHSFGQSPMVQLYWDAANNRPAPSNPWFNPAAKHAFNVGYDINHESAATQYFVSRVVEHWLQEYKIDGFRFDLSKGFTQKNTCDANGGNCDVNAWSAYDASRVALWKKYFDTVQSKANGSYVILEHFADNTEEKELAAYGMMFWGNLNYNFSEGTMGYVGNSNLSGALHTQRGWDQPHLVAYMESHDEERVQYKNTNFGAVNGAYNVKDPATGLRRNEMAAAFLFSMPGPKMLWQFGELGYDFSINHCANGTVNNNCRVDNKPIRWDYKSVFPRQRLHDAYSGMLKLRQHPSYNKVFVGGNVTSSLAGAFKWLRLTTDTSSLVTIGNYDVVASTGVVTFPQAGTWYDYFSGQTINVTELTQTITLQPGEYHVYLNRNITNVLTPVSDVVYQRENTRLRVYPNPVRQGSIIEYELPSSGTVTFTMTNSMGQRVGSVISKFQAKGAYRMDIRNMMSSGKQLASGNYFVKLEFGSVKKIQQIVLEP
jgi:1,4-alpha-glucan branching enzyme